MSGALVWLGIALLGGAGAWQRFRVAAAVTARRPGDFPAGTFAVNLTGSFTLGLLTGLSVSGDALLILGTGFLGAYTTFSTWMLESQRLGEEAEWLLLWGHLFGSMAAGLAATGAGWLLGGVLS